MSLGRQMDGGRDSRKTRVVVLDGPPDWYGVEGTVGIGEGY